MKGNAAVGDWAEALAKWLGRSATEVAENGLGASDFASATEVHVDFEDGSTATFRYAFAVESERRDEIGVFTEHCGYWCFPRRGVTIRVTKRSE